MEVLFVGIGGAFGSLARFYVGKVISKRIISVFPISTYVINIIGAFSLGIVSTISNYNIYVLLGDGFLGAFTTFSTFMYEGVDLAIENRKTISAIYIVTSVLIAVVAFVFGVHYGNKLL